MPNYPLLFKPFEIPPFQLKNRITMAPLFTMYAQGDGRVSELTLNHYGELARSGVAMIVVANVAVDSGGVLSRHSLRADSDRFIPGLSLLAETIKKENVAAVLQINHGGRFARSDRLLAPSAVPLSDISLGGIYRSALKSLDIQQQWSIVSELIQYRPERIRVMTKSDIRRIMTAYAAAAVRARKAGFDMVEIHGGTGYLPVQFLSPRTNKRTDRYGGDLENRMRFPLELTRAVKDAVGAAVPVGYRFQADEWLPNGFGLDEAKIFAGRLSELPVAYLSVTGGTYESFADKEIMEKSHQPCYMVHLAQGIKRSVAVPVIASGRIVTPDLAETVLREDKADLIGLARPLFADPLWPLKAKAGQPEAITACVDCGTCFQFLISNQPVRCAQWEKDKRIHRQRMIRDTLKPPQKILIALDGSENAAMGAIYAGDMLAGRSDVQITLLHIRTEESDQNEQDVRKIMEISQAVLIKAGIPAKSISIQFRDKKTGIARDVLDEIEAGDYGTVIVGRRGLSRAKQFLFGSVSNKIVHNTRDCTVWVVD
jgi:2,4-dienoyl-CoA reductase-like NADH-dependent reductase (Old Yellow Enzyme family)/nucleotide-binding universal stress UspA family protein